MPLRCLLVDDNDAFLETASLLLERGGLTVVGVASSIAEALRQTRALRPDLILVDIGLGNESGFTLAWLLARRWTMETLVSGAAPLRIIFTIFSRLVGGDHEPIFVCT